jgi:hypothetical protein
MKLTRGDIADRFDKIRATYLDAYHDFRGALKQSEVLALEVLKKDEANLDAAKAELTKASETVSNYTGTDPAERASLELKRDEQLRALQDEDKRYQIAKDLADNLTISYITSEVIMARLHQTTNAKERVYAQAVSFFSTNDSVLTALKASFTGLIGLHESTQSLETMKECVSKSIEVLSQLGDKVQEAAVRAGYGPTVRANAVVKLVDSITTFQEKSFGIIEEMRKLSTQNSEEIRAAVEDGKRRLEPSSSKAKLSAPMSDTAVGVSAPKLDELMLAMDVVDTLRHDQRLVERELLADASDEALIKRLRELYKGQGIEVPDRFSKKASRRSKRSASLTSRHAQALRGALRFFGLAARTPARSCLAFSCPLWSLACL